MTDEFDVLLGNAIETGKTENGDYIKLCDGVLICFMNVTEAPRYLSVWGALHLYGLFPEISFPHPFIDKPIISISNIYGSTFMVGQINHTKNALQSFECVRPDKLSTIPDSTFSVYVIGRWK